MEDYFIPMLQGLYDFPLTLCREKSEVFKTLTELEHEGSLFALVDYSFPMANEVIEHLLSLPKSIPCIILAGDENIKQAQRTYKSQTLLEYLDYFAPADDIQKTIDKMLKIQGRGAKERAYCKVSLNLFFSTEEIFCDVYIRLNDNKYLKVFNRYEKINIEDLNKYIQKRISHLYVRERDFSLITKKILQQIRPTQSSNHYAIKKIPDKKLGFIFSRHLQETVSENIQKIGLNEEAVEMTNYAISTTLNLVDQYPDIKDLLTNNLNGDNYASEHCLLLSYISCSLLRGTLFDDKETRMAMTIAAFFHDICLDDSIVKIQDTKEYAYRKLGFKEQEEFLDHPNQAVEVIKQIEGIPKICERIVFQHHERYDGSGFPQGIDHKLIHPLSCIFNLAHEIVFYLYETGSNQANLNIIIDNMARVYTEGNYKLILDAAKKTLRVQSLIDKKVG